MSNAARRQTLILTWAIASLLCASPQIGLARDDDVAKSDEPASKNYVLFPIKTELQRSLISRSAGIYAQFDVAEVVHEGKFDPQQLDKEEFRKDLSALAQEIVGPSRTLQIYFRYSGVSLDEKETQAMERAITSICRQAGFSKVSAGMSGEGEAWQHKTKRFADLVDDSDANETPIEDEIVRVYPVRTKLSRFFLGAPDYDCFVELRQPIDSRFTAISETQRRVIAQRIAQLELSHKRKLTFRCLTTRGGKLLAERYLGQHDGQPAGVKSFVTALGFQDSTYSMVVMSVSPEDLIGKQAPDFTLDLLTGEKVRLREMIRDRVALIAFWGVACGACRVEAPYLSALHDQYKKQGLAVVAVNGYDETKDVVAKYVRTTGLTHPIALMGGKIAKEKYTVASYPVTFLVNKAGEIVDYHLGFEPGDEKGLTATISRLLDELKSGD
jgi:thiol-disulfide isomerase/thioredoxin